MKIKSSFILAFLLMLSSAVTWAYKPISTNEKEVKTCQRMGQQTQCYRAFPNKKGGITGCVSINGGKEVCKDNPMTWTEFIAQVNIEAQKAAARAK